ncbi:hypothetical protein CAEBREN_16367 [Caenorhabditis brenneri]|uniref:Uncharacterized protein n=1 Tax=Caenorhabditis brenneri TaxID=135651 RepID=G0MMS0_CAEBE|nr:hypothetical protein CAEBREN_16367 [Caenorhabditis brenneri]
MAEHFNSSANISPPPQDISQLIPDLPYAAERYRQFIDKSNNTVSWTPLVIQEERNSTVWDVNVEGFQSPLYKPTPGYYSCPLWQETARILTEFKSPRTFDWKTMDLSAPEKDHLTIIEKLLLESRAIHILWTQMNPNWTNRNWLADSSDSTIWELKKMPETVRKLNPMATPLDHSMREFFGCGHLQQTGTPFDVEPVMKMILKHMMEMRASHAADDRTHGDDSQDKEDMAVEDHIVELEDPESGLAGNELRDAVAAEVKTPESEIAKNRDDEASSNQSSDLNAVVEHAQEDMVAYDSDAVNNDEVSDAVHTDAKILKPEFAMHGNENVQIVADQNLEPMFDDDQVMDHDFDNQTSPYSLNSGSPGLRSDEEDTEDTPDSPVGSALSTEERSLSTSSQGSSGELGKADLSRKDPKRNQVHRFVNARNCVLGKKPSIPVGHPDYQGKVEQLNQHFQVAPVFHEGTLKCLKNYLMDFMLVPGEPLESFPKEKIVYPPTPSMLWTKWNKQIKNEDFPRFEQLERDDPRFQLWFGLMGMIQEEVLYQIKEGFITGEKRRKGVKKERKTQERDVPPLTVGTLLAAALVPSPPGTSDGLAPTIAPRAPKRKQAQKTSTSRKMRFNTTTLQYARTVASQASKEMALPSQGTFTTWNNDQVQLLFGMNEAMPGLMQGLFNALPKVDGTPVAASAPSESDSGPSTQN